MANSGPLATENLVVEDRVIAFHSGGQRTLIKMTPLDSLVEPGSGSGESACYRSSFPITPYPGATGHQNEARATITNDPRGGSEPLGPGAEAPFTLPASPTTVNDQVNVQDTNGMSWLFNATGSVNYTKTFTCDQDEGRHDNTATIVETGQIRQRVGHRDLHAAADAGLHGDARLLEDAFDLRAGVEAGRDVEPRRWAGRDVLLRQRAGTSSSGRRWAATPMSTSRTSTWPRG